MLRFMAPNVFVINQQATAALEQKIDVFTTALEDLRLVDSKILLLLLASSVSIALNSSALAFLGGFGVCYYDYVKRQPLLRQYADAWNALKACFDYYFSPNCNHLKEKIEHPSLQRLLLTLCPYMDSEALKLWPASIIQAAALPLEARLQVQKIIAGKHQHNWAYKLYGGGGVQENVLYTTAEVGRRELRDRLDGLLPSFTGYR